MTRKPRAPLSDVRAISRLTFDGIIGLVDVVEAVHHNIAGLPGLLGAPRTGRTRGITGLVYRSVRGVVGFVGHGLDRVLAGLIPALGEGSHWPGREAALAVLNGVLGDYLAATRNALAIPMRFRRDGQPLPMETEALAAALPEAGGKLLVLVHGLCMNDLQWKRRGHDHGAALARDLGYTPVYLHYNSGLHISTNGRAFADALDALVKSWPVPLSELVLVAHSMGGLLCRSAFHYGTIAGHGWTRQVAKLVFLGTPHHGAPLERGGNWVDVLLGVSPYVAPLARLGKIRSAGITDLRYGNLLDEDWAGRDRFEPSGDRRLPVPLPENVACHVAAATTGKRAGVLADVLIGDGIVPLNSALGRHDDPRLALAFPESRTWIGYGMNHLDLLGKHAVYEQIRKWLAAPL